MAGYGTSGGWNTGQTQGTGGFGGYYDASSDYGWNRPGDPSTSPMIGGPNGYLENTPQAAFTRHTGALGMQQGNPESNFNQFVRRQYGLTRDGYEAAAASNPLLTYQKYLGGLGGFQDWYSRFQSQSPDARGEDWGQFAPRSRWIPR